MTKPLPTGYFTHEDEEMKKFSPILETVNLEDKRCHIFLVKWKGAKQKP